MEIIGPLLLSLLAGLSTLLGCVLLFIKIKKIDEFITFSLSFSFIVIISISLFDLLINSSYTLYMNYKGVLGLLLALFIFVLGNICIRRINNKIDVKNGSNLYRVGVLSMISLILHNFPEGIAVFMSAYSNINIGFKICLAIMLHNIPEGIIISMPLYYSGVSKRKVIKYTFISGISEPLGAIIGYLLLKNIMTDVVLAIILIFVSGIMINLSINEIYKEMISYNKYKYIILGIIVGSIFIIAVKLI